MSSLIIAVIIVIVLKLIFSCGFDGNSDLSEDEEFEWWLEDNK